MYMHTPKAPRSRMRIGVYVCVASLTSLSPEAWSEAVPRLRTEVLSRASWRRDVKKCAASPVMIIRPLS